MTTKKYTNGPKKYNNQCFQGKILIMNYALNNVNVNEECTEDPVQESAESPSCPIGQEKYS